MPQTKLDHGFLRGRRHATARKERLVFDTEAIDPFAGPASPDNRANLAPKPSRRRRALAALAITAAAGGLLGGYAAIKGSGNAAPKAPVSTSAQAKPNMFAPIVEAGTKLGAYEKQQAAAEVQQTVNGIANTAASRIIHMTATDPHVRQDPGTAKNGFDMYAWGGDYAHPESEASVWHDQLTVSTINEPGGQDGKTWNSVKIEYKIPDSMRGQFDHPMAATDWEHINLSGLQFESMNVQDDSGAEGTTLAATHGGYHLDGEAVDQPDQLASFGQSVNDTLDRLTVAQHQFA